MNSQTFAEWMTALLQYLHLPLPAQPAPPVATFHFDGPFAIHVTGDGNHIDAICESGVLCTPYSSDLLLELLALNRCNQAGDAVSVGIDRPSGTLLVWARQRQMALTPADATCLLQGVRQKADMVQQLLGKPALPPRGSSAAMLSRMLHQPVHLKSGVPIS